MKLAILIPTVAGREMEFESLLALLAPQVEHADVQIQYLKDNKEMSIGAKRQALLDACEAEYMVMIDDDDHVPHDYVAKVMEALESPPDCIGYLEQCDIGGRLSIACHSNRYERWQDNYDGYHHVRTIFYKDVIKTSIAKQVGFRDLRYGEDHDFSIRLKQSGLLKNEVFIKEIMYYYSAPIMTEDQYNLRYGIK